MARVTVEDCVDKIPNRFELVLLAGHRARTISAGPQIAVQRDNDKNPVMALREIAEKTIPPDDLRGRLHPLDPEKRRGGRAGGEAVPMLSTDTRMPRARPATTSRATPSIDMMTEEQLLRRMEATPGEPSDGGPMRDRARADLASLPSARDFARPLV